MSEITADNVICLETVAFHRLIDEVVKHLDTKQKGEGPRWINDKQAMEMLSITSRTTLQKFRDEGRIRFSQPSRKLILYDRQSILDFLERNARDTF